MSVNKLIVTNGSALQTKYGAGYAQIQAALTRLLEADSKRGLVTVVAAVDDSKALAQAQGTPVTDAADPKQNKAAIDALYRFYNPEYLLILGAVDVIPHQDLLNPVFIGPDSLNGDPDRYAYGDLPYACSGPYSQTVRDFINPTRVVGRLPDVTKGSDPTYLVGLLDTAAQYVSRPAGTYKQFLGVGAAVWSRSTQLSLKAAFGSAAGLQNVPPRSYRWTTKQLRKPAHFFNCHGAAASAQYYGQPASGAASYPVAHDAAYLAGKTAVGTVVAAECCYGAELFDPALAGNQQGIPNQYLQDKAYGFFGSSTVAYGPSDSNAYADLLCQYFFFELLQGASLGRAVLQARQRYIAQAANLSPTDLKTLAQFSLLGDPAVHPVTPPPSPVEAHLLKGARGFPQPQASELAGLARAQRRTLLAQNGLALAGSVSCAEESGGAQPPAEMRKLLEQEARKLGVSKVVTFTCGVQAPTSGAAGAETKALGVRAVVRVPKAIHVALGPARKQGASTRSVLRGGRKVVPLAGVEIAEYEGDVVIQRFVSR